MDGQNSCFRLNNNFVWRPVDYSPVSRLRHNLITEKGLSNSETLFRFISTDVVEKSTKSCTKSIIKNDFKTNTRKLLIIYEYIFYSPH